MQRVDRVIVGLETRDKSAEHRSTAHDRRCQVIDFAIGERNLTVRWRHSQYKTPWIYS